MKRIRQISLKLVYIVLSIFLVSTVFSGCAAGKKVPPPEERNNSTFTPGDLVRIKTLDQKIYQFKVVEIGNDFIAGKDNYIFFRDIETIDKMKSGGSSGAGTVILVSAVMVAGLTALLLSQVGGPGVSLGSGSNNGGGSSGGNSGSTK